MKKKFLSIVLGLCFLFTNQIGAFAQNKNITNSPPSNKYIFHGHAEINTGQEDEQDIFTGETTTVEKGTNIQMTVSNVISSGYSLEGDEFFAEITNDVETEEGIVIPSGSVAHGRVSTIKESKKLGRDGYVTLDFDYVVTPDGREIPIEGKMTTKRHPVASFAEIIAEDAAYTVGGSLAGGVAALKLFGIGGAISSNGYTIAGGAGVGALLGAGIALGRSGESVLLAPGDEIKVKIMGALELPVISEEAFKQKELSYEGLDVRITNYRLEKDPFGEPNTITLGLVIINRTSKTFSSFDMALVNDYKAVYYASPFGNTELWFTRIKPFTRIAGRLSFSVDNPKRKHWLVFYDNRTRKPLAKISVDNAIREIKKYRKHKKKR